MFWHVSPRWACLGTYPSFWVCFNTYPLFDEHVCASTILPLGHVCHVSPSCWTCLGTYFSSSLGYVWARTLFTCACFGTYPTPLEHVWTRISPRWTCLCAYPHLACFGTHPVGHVRIRTHYLWARTSPHVAIIMLLYIGMTYPLFLSGMVRHVPSLHRQKIL